MNAIELTNVTKIYRRYSGRQFATLKSALLQRSILRDLQASETFPPSPTCRLRSQGLDLRRDRQERLRKEHGA